MPDRRSIFRLLALAGFLLTVALALWLAELRPLLVVVVMALALLVAWTVEWLSWRQDLLRLGTEAAGLGAKDSTFTSIPPPLTAPAAEVAAEESPQAAAPSVEVGEAEPVDAPTPVEPSPAEAPVATPPLKAEPAEPEPPAPETPAPAPVRPALRPVPAPPPPARPAAQQPARPAAASGVIDLRTRVTAQPRRWNLWDLERRARDEAQRDPIRYEEWSYLFVHLRQFASPDGSLPTEFDGLVRESFGDLLEHAGPMNAALARRQAALAGVALVGALGAIALSRVGDDSDAAPPPDAVAGWETATVGVFEPTAELTACGVEVTAVTVGIAHPVLPCGAKLLVEHQGRQAQADVVERGPVDPGQTFELSPALAQQLGVEGEAAVRWRFAE